MPVPFLINWNPGTGRKAYVTKGSPNRKPYTENPAEAQHWQTRKAAERFLSRKDPLWASRCQIEETPSVPEGAAR